MSNIEHPVLLKILIQALPPVKERDISQLELDTILNELKRRILANKVLRRSIGLHDENGFPFTPYAQIHPIGLSRMRECVSDVIDFILNT